MNEGRMLAPYVRLGLAICEKLEIADKRGQGMIMKFCKLYPQEKIIRIFEYSQTFPWSKSNPVAAFMKSVGIINKQEKIINE